MRHNEHDFEHFDDYQFQKPDTAKQSDIIIAKGASIAKSEAHGMQVITPTVYPHYDAAWAKDPKQVLKVLRDAFPAVFRENDTTLMTERRSFSLCSRWHEVIILYFKDGWDRRSIADRMGLTYESVNTLIRTIRRARKGLRRDGKPRKR